MGFRIAFTPQASGSTSTAGALTVPAGVVASDVICIVCVFIVSVNLTATTSTSGSGTLTQRASVALSTSAWMFVYTGTGFVAGDTITVTPSSSGRVVSVGVAYSSVSYETVGSTGATSTTVATSPSTAAANNNDIALGISTGVASATGRTFSSLTSGWASKTFQQSGSNTRFQMAQISELAMPTAGNTGDLVATASGALLASGGVQIILSSVVGGSGTTSKVRVAGVATSAAQDVRVAGVTTAAVQKVRVGGVAV